MLITKSQVRINAPVEEVWQVVTNMEFYSDWNSQLSLLDGRVQAGEKITIKYKPLFYRSFTLNPQIHRFENQQSFGWKGITKLPSFLDGEIIFDFEKMGEQATRLSYSQSYSGWLAFLLPRLEIFKDAHKSCIKMNAEIKRRVEEIFAQKVTFPA